MLKHIMEDTCPKCGNLVKKVPAGISKKGNHYPAFMSCTSRGCNWTGGIEVDTKSTQGGLGVVSDKTNKIEKIDDNEQRIINGLLKIYKRLDELELKIDSLLPESHDNGESFK